MNKMPAFLDRFLKYLTLPPEAVFPVLVGLFIGLFYGAAIIIQYAREGLLKIYRYFTGLQDLISGKYIPEEVP